MSDPPDEPSLRRANLVLPLRSVAVGSATVALTSIIALIVVASVHKADTLATVALALATIAFVVQIIVFIAQATAAGQQMLQAQELFGKMQELLGRSGEQTADTKDTVRKLDDRWVTAELNKTVFHQRSQHVCQCAVGEAL